MNKRYVTVVALAVVAVTMLSGVTSGQQPMEEPVTESVVKEIEPTAENVLEEAPEVEIPLPAYNLLVRGEPGEAVEVTQDGLLVATIALDDRGEGVLHLSIGTYTATCGIHKVGFRFTENASLMDVVGGTYDREILLMS